MNNIQKAFKTKSKLRGMADGGQVRPTPEMLGSGMAQRAGSLLQGRQAQLDAAIDAASGAPPPSPAPTPATPATPVTAAPAKKPEEKSALRSFFGFADGGQILKNDVGGVPTFTDARAATAGAKAYTPGQGGGSFSVVGMEPAQKQQMADAAAKRQAAANAPTTLGGRLDAALGKLNSPLATAGAPSSTPTLGSELDAAIGRTKGVTSPQTPATGAPANDANRIMNSRDMSIFTPQEMKTFNGMGQAAMADAAHMQDVGVQAGQAALAAAHPAELPAVGTDDMAPPEIELADGGKVKGKGGPTDDKVGPVALSDGEYVLPADTVDAVGRDKLDALRLATHDFVDEDNKPRRKGLRGMADGGVRTREDLLLQPALQTGGGGALVPPSPPTGTAMVPFAPSPSAGELATRPVAEAAAPGAARTGAKSLLRNSAQVLGEAATPIYAAMDAYMDSPEARKRAASGQDGVAGAAGMVGSYLGSALTGGTFSPQDIGAIISRDRGEGTSAYHAVPENEKGWARQLGEKYLPTESADIVNRNPVQLSQYSKDMSDTLAANGVSLGSLKTPEDFQRARDVLHPPAQRPPVRVGVNPTAEQLGAAGVLRQPSSDVAMGNLRRGLPPGDGFSPTAVPGIYGRKSDDPGNLGDFVGVGKEPTADEKMMTQIRDAIQGLSQSADRGYAYTPPSNVDAINERYDKLAKQLSGMYSAKGQGNLARRLLELEQSRTGALDADARNQSALRGQDVSADGEHARTAAYLRAQAAQNLTTILEGRQRALAAMGKGSKPDKPIDTDTFLDSTVTRLAGGDKEAAAKLRVKLVNLPEQTLLDLQAMPQVDRTRAVSDLLDVDNAARNDAQTGRDAGAMAARTGAFGVAAGGSSALARASARKLLGTNASKARDVAALIDKGIGFIPKIGKPISKLRLFERLASLTGSPLAATIAGASYGAATTPDRGELSPKETYSFATDADANGNPIPVTEGNSWWTNANRYGPIDATLPGFADNYVFNNAHVAVKRPDMDAQAAMERVRKRKSKLRDSDGGE